MHVVVDVVKSTSMSMESGERERAQIFVYQQIPVTFRFQLANICILDPPPSFEIQYGIGINSMCACTFFSSPKYKIIMRFFYFCQFVSSGMTAYTTANECHIVVLR